MAADTLTQTHDRLTQAVEELVTGEDWKAFLNMAACFHTYSPNNIILILSQCPDATRVAGYRTWQRLGRQVRKGERGIVILAPCTYRRSPADDNASDNQETEDTKVLRGFRGAYVFDLAQTDGDPLPHVEAPPLLEGEAPAQLWETLAAQVTTAGYQLHRGHCDGANGRTDYLARAVTVRADVDPAQAAKTLAHELAHVLLHHPEASEHSTCRGLIEIEAESVAHLICATVGLNTDPYSFAYVAHWANGDTTLIRATATRVIDTARRILAGSGLLAPIEEKR